jgi:hypothetical protein
MERRNFIRALIAVAIGVPIAVEGVTFSRLFYQRLTGAEPSHERPTGEGVEVGEDLLPATDAAETVTEMTLEAASETEWTFRMVVDVANPTEQTYRLKLGPVSLGDGSTVGETISTGEMAPAGSTTLSGEWTVPSGSTVTGIWAGGKTGEDSVTERVLLAPIEEPS